MLRDTQAHAGVHADWNDSAIPHGDLEALETDDERVTQVAQRCSLPRLDFLVTLFALEVF